MRGGYRLDAFFFLLFIKKLDRHLIFGDEFRVLGKVLFTLVQWGQLHLKQKNDSLASSTFHEARKIAQEVGIQELIAKANYGLAQVALAQGEQKLARKQAEEALAIFETISHAEAEEVRRWLAKVGTVIKKVLFQ